MGLFDKFTNLISRDSPQANYLSLAVSPSKVLAIIWVFADEKVEVLGFGEKKFENADGLIHAAAFAIDKAGEVSKSDVEKTVFGVSDFWLTDGKPKDETNKILKELSGELELSPQAFISQAASINHLLKVEENQTPRVVLVGLYDDFCEVHLLENNNVAKSVSLASPTNVEKVTSLISRLKSENQDLPSRIIIFGESEEIAEKLKKHDFGNLFVHEPKIEILNSENLAKAVAFAQAADVLGHEPSLVAVSAMPRETAKPKGTEDEAGFVEGEDILKTKEEAPHVREDYAVETDESQLMPSEQNVKLPKKPLALPKIPKFALPAFLNFEKSPKKIAIILGILLAISLVASFVASKTLTSAEITVKVNAQETEGSFKVDVDPKAKDSSSKIRGVEISANSTGSQKGVATGSKKLGDKSKGTVKILNWDKQAKTFGSGAELITKDGLKFTLDNEIQVASRSATTPSESKAGATSADFGPKYNINAGAEMTIVGFDEIFYSAVSDSAFTGGAERQATVVTEDDLTKLEKSVTESAVVKAKEELIKKAEGKKIENEAIITKVIKRSFDKKVDDEASLINLDLEVEVSAIAYDEGELKEFIAKNSLTNLPENFEARAQDLELSGVSARRQKDILSLSGKFRAPIIPKIDQEGLKDKVKGKSAKESREIIKNTIADFADVTVKFSPGLPFFESIPTDKSKIKITLVAL